MPSWRPPPAAADPRAPRRPAPPPNAGGPPRPLAPCLAAAGARAAASGPRGRGGGGLRGRDLRATSRGAARGRNPIRASARTSGEAAWVCPSSVGWRAPGTASATASGAPHCSLRRAPGPGRPRGPPGPAIPFRPRESRHRRPASAPTRPGRDRLCCTIACGGSPTKRRWPGIGVGNERSAMTATGAHRVGAGSVRTGLAAQPLLGAYTG